MTTRRNRKWFWLFAGVLAVTAFPAAVYFAGYLNPRTVPERPVTHAGPDSAAWLPTAPVTPPEEQSTLVLDNGEREYLWQVEHQGLVLDRHGFRPLADALRHADQDGLRKLLAPGFIGRIGQDPHEVRLDADYAHVLRRQYADQPHFPKPLGLEQFLARLMEYRRLFSNTKPPKVKLALMALAPERREVRNGSWRGTCQLRMWGEATNASGPAEVVLYLAFRILQPTEEALAKGKWLLECALNQSQVARAPAYLMREVAAERGIDVGDFHDNWPTHGNLTTTGGVYLCDYDRDGILDLLITDINRFALYKGLPAGKFRDVTAEVGLPMASPDLPGLASMAAFVDLDGDGWEDLILGDRIYRNDNGRRFVDYTSRTNLRLPRDAAGIAIADFDRDGRLDLYVTRPGKDKADSWLDGKSGDAKGNQLWRNLGNWRFEDMTASSGADGGQRSTGTAVWLDANNDGWPDLYVINEFGNGVLLLNRGDGTFREQMLVDGLGDFGSMGVTCGDIDNDGNIDLYVANMYSKAGNRVIGNLKPDAYPAAIMAKMRRFVAGSQLYRNRGTGKKGKKGDAALFALPVNAQLSEKLGAKRAASPFLPSPSFEPLGKQYQVAGIGWAYGAALVDLDNDGWLDLYATCGFISQSRTEPDG
jgi:hypothetical protein